MATSNEDPSNIQQVTTTNELMTATPAAATIPDLPKVDIEHVTVYDDPRQWSRARKVH
jgi:hypothetical protein